jgi:lipopolysaccharide transport system permease protein
MQFKNQLTVISTLTMAELKGRYRNTFAGVIWVMINPLILFSVHALIFKHILKINVDKYYIFLLSGLIPWIFMSTLLLQTVNIFITKRDSLLSFQIHPVSVIIAKCIDCLINFIIPFMFLFIILSIGEEFNPMALVFMPILMIIMFIGTTAMAITFSVIQVFFRDVEYILTFVMNVLFFLTPIFYPRHLIPDKFQVFVDINPFYTYIRGFKATLWEFNYGEIYNAIGVSLLFMALSVALSIIIWKKFRNELYLNI